MKKYLKSFLSTSFLFFVACHQGVDSSNLNVYDRTETDKTADHLWCEIQYTEDLSTGEKKEGYCLYSVKRKGYKIYESKLLTPYGHPRQAIRAHIAMHHSELRDKTNDLIERCRRPLGERFMASGWRSTMEEVIALGNRSSSPNSYQHGPAEQQPHERGLCQLEPKIHEH